MKKSAVKLLIIAALSVTEKYEDSFLFFKFIHLFI